MRAREPLIYVLSFAAFVYFAFFASPPHLPGLNHEEIKPAQVVYQWPGQVTPMRVSGVPLMTTTSEGALKAWIAAPLFRRFGPDVALLRSIGPAMLLVAFVLAIVAARRRFGPRPAMIFAFLLCFDPSILHFARTDFGPFAAAFLARCALLFSLLAFQRNGRISMFWIACFSAGVGMWERPDFLFFIVALALAYAIVRPPIMRLGADDMVVGGGLFAIGYAPFIVAAVKWDWLPIRLAANVHPVFSLELLSDKWTALVKTLRALYPSMLYFPDKIGSRGFVCKPTMVIETLFILIVLLIGLKLWKRKPIVFADKGPPFLFAALGTHAAMSLLFPGPFEPDHYMMMTPLPQLAVATMLLPVCGAVGSTATVRRVACLMLLVPLLFGGVYSSMSYKRAVNGIEGRLSFTTATYALADRIEALPDAPILIADPWIAPVIQFLVPEKAGNVREIFWDLAVETGATDAHVKRMRNALVAGAYLVTHSVPGTHYEYALDEIDEGMAARGLFPNLIYTVEDQDETPYLFLFELTEEPIDTDR